MNELYERLKDGIKKLRAEEAENLALGYAMNDYQYRVGLIRALDDVIVMGDKIIRDMNNGK